MAYKKMKSLPLRDADVPFETRAPGLYQDEHVVKLENALVAVSVHSKLMVTSGGIEITGWARWIDSAGMTNLDPAEQEVEIETRHTFDAGFVTLFGVDVLCRQVLLALMGEPVEKTGEGEEIRPIIDWPEDVLLQLSIRNAIDVAAKTGVMNAGDLI
jgi:hypothetical protein